MEIKNFFLIEVFLFYKIVALCNLFNDFCYSKKKEFPFSSGLQYFFLNNQLNNVF